mgnify:CR=1 FL=1
MTVFVFRNLDATESAEVGSAFARNDIKVLTFESRVQESLKDQGISSALFEGPSKSELIAEFKQEILQFGHKSFAELHSKLIDTTSYSEQFYPWFMIRNKLFLDLHELYVEYRWFLLAKKDRGNKGQLQIFSNHSALGSLVKIEVRSGTSVSRPKAKKEPIKYAFVFLARFFLGLIKPIRKGRHLFLNSSIVSHKIFSLDGTCLIDGDFYYGYLQDELKKSSDFSNLLMLKNYGAVALPKFKDCLKPFKNIGNFQFYETFAGLGLLNVNRLQRMFLYRNRLKRNISEALTIAQGFDSMILNQLLKASDLLVVSAFRYDLGLAILKKLKPQSIGGDDELTFLKYPLIAAAKQLGVPSFGLQHGGISSSNLNYSFLKKDVKYDPFPDVTMTWGEYVLDRLCKQSSYPEGKVKVVGQVRTDVVKPLLEQPKSSILADYKKGETIVLFASQPIYHQPEIRKRLLMDVLTLQKNNPILRVIIKPHPNEKKDMSFFEGVAQEVGVKPEIRFDDLYGLLAVTDIMITYYSTAGAEALYFNKELVVIDYNGIDSANYIKDRVARHCEDYNTLEETVKSVIDGSAKDISEIRNNYLNKRVYSIDGNSRFRVIEKIRALGKK